MTIIDLPFKNIFDGLELFTNTITKIFDYKSVESVIDEIKYIFNQALKILRRVPCVLAMPIMLMWDQVNNLITKIDVIGLSLEDFVGDWLRDKIQEIRTFNNDKCLTNTVHDTSTQSLSPNKSEVQFQKWQQIKSRHSSQRGGMSYFENMFSREWWAEQAERGVDSAAAFLEDQRTDGTTRQTRRVPTAKRS